MRLPELAERVDGLGASEFDGPAYRHVSAGTKPRSGTGARIHGGRWNPPDSFATLYLGLSRGTVIAEWRRAASREGLALEDFLPRVLFEFHVTVSGVVDLRREEAQAAVSLSRADLTGVDQHPCQRVGEAVHYLGYEGLLAPSATREGEILVLYPENLRADSYLEIRSQESWIGPPAE
jgi:RES domain-containing protein